MNTMIIPVTVESSTQIYQVGVSTSIQIVDPDYYEGSYSVVPSDVEQVLETKDLAMADNITVAPIPDNYGLITWNGSVLTVS